VKGQQKSFTGRREQMLPATANRGAACTLINKILHFSFPSFTANYVLSAFLIKIEDEMTLFNRLPANCRKEKEEEKPTPSASLVYNDCSLLNRTR